ncbi:hypothetical protein [Coxiella-like endosymbiont]
MTSSNVFIETKIIGTHSLLTVAKDSS